MTEGEDAPAPVAPSPVDAQERYRTLAEDLLRRVERAWMWEGDGDATTLTHAGQAALAAAARHELVQIFSQMELQIDVLSRAVSGAGKDDSYAAAATPLRDALGRAAGLAKVFLDPAEIARLLIRLETESVELGALVEARLDAAWRSGLGERLEAEIGTASILGDREKMIVVVDHLIGRFAREARPDQRVRVAVGPFEGQAEVFIGLVPDQAGPERLVAELQAPLQLEGLAMDIPYARAVVERHGGQFLVARTDDGGAGFRFRIPLYGDEAHEAPTPMTAKEVRPR